MFRDPWTTTHPDRPVTDDVSAAILDAAVTLLTLLRSPLSLGDALAELHAMVSLLAELQIALPATVAAARDQDHTWHDIAHQLQITPASARRRYRGSRTSNTGDSDVTWTGPRRRSTCSSVTRQRTSTVSTSQALLKTAALDAGVPLRDVQEAASHADPCTTMRYDRARVSLDRHATYIVATFLAGASR